MVPQKIQLHQKSKTLELIYPNMSYVLEAEYLRVHSPSAEVQRHGNPETQFGKKHVGIKGLSMVGRYAVKIEFDDGHNTGLFTWTYLQELCEQQEEKWQAYLAELHQKNLSRDPDVQVVQVKHFPAK